MTTSGTPFDTAGSAASETTDFKSIAAESPTSVTGTTAKSLEGVYVKVTSRSGEEFAVSVSTQRLKELEIRRRLREFYAKNV